MMRQLSASSTNINPDYYHSSASNPFDSHVDNFGAKRMRKHTQRRAVDYTSTLVRYIQGIQGGMNPHMSQSHYMVAPSGVFPGPPSSGGPQMYPQGRGFNRPKMIPGYNNPFQQQQPQPPLPAGPPPNTNQQHQ